METFIGRTREIKQLQQVISKSLSTITVVYGRRRVGKSALIRKALENRKAYFFEGLENQSKSHQILNFLSQLSFQTKKESPKILPKNWRDAFKELLGVCAKESIVIVFDEFQWMANYRSDIVSDLKMFWEQYLSRLGSVHLILCGSIASFMIKKVLRSKALFGRTDLEIHLKPFSVSETKKILCEHSGAEVLESHLLVGGIPKYLELLKQKTSIHVAIQELSFTPNGYFTEEYNRIFVSHFGENHDFKKIIESLAHHPYGLNRTQISKIAKIELGGGLTNQLYDLEMAGFIQSYQPFNKNKNSKQILYCLKDAYMRFYFSFIKPELKKIAGDINDIFYRITQTSAYLSWLGQAFEYLCMDHAKKISSILGFSGIDYTYGPYFEAGNKNKKGIQIDLLFDRADHVLNVCEIKYTGKKPGKEIIAETEKKIELIESKTKKTIQKILITKTEPSQDLLRSGYFYKIIQAEELLSE
jgi:AAA+ ATPase superfamily predicted ATPase